MPEKRSSSGLAELLNVPVNLRSQTPAQRSRAKRALRALIFMVLAYGLLAYVSLPMAWRWRTSRHPSFDTFPHVTRTSSGIHGDPLNVAIVASEEDLNHIMLEAGWIPADPITFASCVKISAATVLRRMYQQAPVSSLMLFGRKQDLAYQQPVGGDPSRRHHVRFWRAPMEAEGQPVWIGAATYDRSVGLSRTTLQVTHHIDGDVDAERDHLLDNWRQTGRLQDFYWLDDFHRDREGKNGGGDRYFTDGRLAVAFAMNRASGPGANSDIP